MEVPLVSIFTPHPFWLALLTKDYVLLVGQKTPKNQIFIFDGKGRKFKTIMLESLIEGLTSHTKWVCLDFNSDEDLLLLTADGRLFLIDLMSGEIRDKQQFPLFNDIQN